MRNKNRSILILIIILFLYTGCYTSSYISNDEYSDEYRNDLLGVVLIDSTIIKLDRVYNIADDTLFVYHYDSYSQAPTAIKKIPFSEISKFEYQSVNPLGVVGITLLSIGAFIGIIALSFSMDGFF